MTNKKYTATNRSAPMAADGALSARAVIPTGGDGLR